MFQDIRFEGVFIGVQVEGVLYGIVKGLFKRDFVGLTELTASVKSMPG